MTLLDNIKKDILNELTESFNTVKNSEILSLIEKIEQKNRVFIYGLGREMLMLKAFGMRLMHLGYEVHIIGDVTTPAINKDDLFITSSGTGYLSTVEALVSDVKKSEAEIAFFTAFPKETLPQRANLIINIKAKTMKEDEQVDSIQPMGSIFEQVQLLLLDLVITQLIERNNITEEQMIPNHTNIE